VSSELFYISDWYVTIAMLAGVDEAHVVNNTGPGEWAPSAVIDPDPNTPVPRFVSFTLYT
jgi:hypothetical protein